MEKTRRVEKVSTRHAECVRHVEAGGNDEIDATQNFDAMRAGIDDFGESDGFEDGHEDVVVATTIMMAVGAY
jgi:hypothetical protein